MVKQYRKKPVVIEAIQYLGANNIASILDWFAAHDSSREIKYNPDTNEYEIVTLEGNMQMVENDFIIRGISGEFYPCKPDIFHATYDLVE